MSADYLSELELRLNRLWQQYMNYIEENGLDEVAGDLKRRYYELYRSYRHSRNWRNLLSN